MTRPAGRVEICVQPHPIIRHMSFHDTMYALDGVRKSSLMSSEFFVEAVAYQQAAIEEMERRAFSVQAMQPMRPERTKRPNLTYRGFGRVSENLSTRVSV